MRRKDSGPLCIVSIRVIFHMPSVYLHALLDCTCMWLYMCVYYQMQFHDNSNSQYIS